jgi:hypothetical protein
MSNSWHDAPTMGIGKLLRDGGRFAVPPNQRDYLWTEDHIEQLLADIGNARSTDQEEYFVGLVVFIPGEGRDEFIILDGQQRLATTVIILASIRNWLAEHKLERDAYMIQERYIGISELGEEHLEPRIVLNENNHPYFEEFVVREASVEQVEAALSELRRYDPNRPLLEAVLYCRKKVEEIASVQQNGVGEAAKRLYEFVAYLTDRVRVVRFTVSSDTNAYLLFETLNYRGVELNVMDLVKNHLLAKTASRAQSREVQVRWGQMIARLANVRADDFLKVYWTSRYGRIQKEQLFPNFKEEVSSAREVSQIMADMLTASEQYAALEIADDPIWAGISDKSRERIRSLKTLGARQVHPVLLSALARFPEGELERLLRLLEVLIVRYQLIGGGRTGRLEIACAATAVGIFRSDLTTTTQVYEEFRERNVFPIDEEFQLAFTVKQEKNNQKARYVFRILEQQARHGLGMEAIELEPGIALTVEHILPQNPGEAWNPILELDPALAEDCTYRYGNLCLLTNVNREIGDSSFVEKQKVFSRSSLQLTKQLAEYEEWDRHTIDQRQIQMAKLAVAAWRFQ